MTFKLGAGRKIAVSQVKGEMFERTGWGGGENLDQIIKSFRALQTILRFAVAININGLQQQSVSNSYYMSIVGLVFVLPSCLLDQTLSGPMPVLQKREKRKIRSHI